MEMFSQINIEQLIIASFTFTAAGIIGFWCKDMPLRLWDFIRRQCTTTVVITSAHNAFYNLMRFLDDNYGNRNFRTFKLTNWKWGNNDITIIGIGYGGHLLKYENLLMYISLIKEASHGTVIDKESVTITKLGRSRKSFERFFKAISTNKQRENHIQIYRMKDYWYPMNQIPKRAMDTVFIEQKKKDIILKTIDDFIKAEEWYINNGIPYHLGILLYGSPGTGKSSLIKAIASYTSHDIYYLPVSNLMKLDDCMDTLPEQSIMVIEDIDCEKVLHNRSGNEDESNYTRTTKQSSDIGSFVNFSDVLNVIDGVCSAHGRILITTTNHIEQLDPALIRPRRIDLKIEIGYVNIEIFNQFLKRFYCKEIGSDFRLKERLKCAELQNLILLKKTFDEIISYAIHETF